MERTKRYGTNALSQSATSPGYNNPKRRQYSFRQIFIASNIVMMGIGLGFGVISISSLYRTQKQSALLRMESELYKARAEIERRFELAELYVSQLSNLSTALASSEPNSFIGAFTESSRKLLETDPSQYETCLALEPEYAKKIAKAKGFLLVISKDRKLVGKAGFNDPKTFSTSIFKDGSYLTDPSAIWYHPAKKLSHPYHTPFYFERTYTNELMTSIGKAVYDKRGKVIGVANIDLTADTFSNFLDGIRFGETGRILVTDEKNNPITPLIGTDRPSLGYRYDPSRMKRTDFPMTLARLPTLHTKGGESTFQGSDGDTYLTIELPLRYRNWKIFAYQNKSEAYASVYKTLFSLIAIGLLLLACLIWTAQKVQRVVFSSVNTILSNIDANSSRAEHIEKGFDFQPIPAEGPKEIRRLSEQLNGLYLTLQGALSELRVARESAEQATIAKSRFLSVMSHEIRTPLHAMLGMADVLASETNDETQKTHIHVIQRTGRTLQRILNDILDFTRIEAGKLVLDHHEFRVFDLISELSALLEPEAKSKGLVFRVIPTATNEIVIGDSLRLKQVLLNLLGNAIKFTNAGFLELKVESTATENPEIRAFTFSVTDSGIGISKDQQERLFYDFTQAENSITRRFGGTGLGLAISKQIVELMGGTLNVRSELGQGSTFYFEMHFPVRGVQPGDYTSSTAPVIETTDPQMTARTLAAGEKSKRILVVDDDDDNHALIEAYFKFRKDVQIIHSYNGNDALQKIERSPSFALVIMDIQMPMMDGYEVVRAIRTRENENRSSLRVPIVVLSANTFSEDREASLNAGADAHIGKPIERSAFFETVSPWI